MAFGGMVLVAGFASALAQGLVVLALGRLVIGVAAGIVSTAATTGLTMLEPS